MSVTLAGDVCQTDGISQETLILHFLSLLYLMSSLEHFLSDSVHSTMHFLALETILRVYYIIMLIKETID